MKTEYRTHHCNELTEDNENLAVRLCGFIHKIRSFGQLVFIDLKDRYGITQLVCDSNVIDCGDLHMQDVLQVEGTCHKRKDPNPKLNTGMIEVSVAKLKRLSKAKTPPFELTEENINENLRLQYRYLDIRRGEVLRNLEVRHQTILAVRSFLDSMNFLEIETPILAKSTPEGARDFLVPSRIHQHSFYALPQSPQQFKQLLMVSGVDRYFQIAKCFRDEDLRADRQIEFSQIDIEMSFATPKDLYTLIEQMMQSVFKKILDVSIQLPFQHLDYQDCMDLYGTDKPDLRFDLQYQKVEKIFEKSSFQVFLDILKNNGIIKALKVEKGATFSRKQIDGYQALVQQDGVKGLGFLKVNDQGMQSPLLKFLDEDAQKSITQQMELQVGDLVFFLAGNKTSVFSAMDHLRRQIAEDMELIDETKYAFAWVEKFPLFEYDEEDKRLYSVHHPFTKPVEESFNSEPLEMTSSGYDLVLNGYELAGGSVRIHDADMQRKVFEILGLEKKVVQQMFGPFLEALSYGTPPHLGIAFGLDRLVMILAKTKQIRDVIAFPKTTSAQDLTIDCPSQVETKQLKDLNITLS